MNEQDLQEQNMADMYDFQEMAWDEYVLWCKANNIKPRLSYFWVWLDDYDSPNYEELND